MNQAALQLALAGRVHAIGCMVGAPQWQAGWVQRLRALRGVDIGLHLDLTEWPLGATSRRTLPALWAAGGWPLRDRSRLRGEIRAQLDAFERDVGRPPDYVDGHRHVHQFAAVRGELLDELERRHAGQLPWLRATHGPAAAAPTAKAWLIAALGAGALRSQALRRGFRTNAALLGVYDFRGGAARYAGLLQAWLAAAQDGDLLMCHPASSAPGDDTIGAARLAEFNTLATPRFDAWLAGAGVTLAPMSGLLRR